MNSLEQMMGLSPMGYPQGQGEAEDPMLQMAMNGDQDAMMNEMGVPPMGDPYASLGMEAPQGVDNGQMLTQQMLGDQPQQLGQDEMNALAFSLGLGNNNGITIDGPSAPMYSDRFDTLRMMGGY